jgi:hypothetical protein
MREKKEETGNRKKDRLEAEDTRVSSTWKFHTADPTLGISEQSVTKLDASSRRKMARSGGFDFQGMHWDEDMGEDLRAPDAYIAWELGRRRVRDGRDMHNYRFA